MSLPSEPGAVTQRWRRRRASYRPAREVIRPADYEVAEIDEATAKAFVVTHHYSGTYPAARFRVGLFRREQLVGVAVFSQPARNEVLTNVFPTGCVLDSVELGRYVLLDSVPGNGESFFLARCFDYLRRLGLVGVIAFSDPVPRRTADGHLFKPGHVGVIYQAANAVYLGRATPRSLHLLPDATVLSARALQKIRAGERGWRYAVGRLVGQGAEAPRCWPYGADVDELRAWLPNALNITRRLRHPGNHRYGWSLSRAARRFLERAGPYPKRPEPEALILPF